MRNSLSKLIKLNIIILLMIASTEILAYLNEEYDLNIEIENAKYPQIIYLEGIGHWLFYIKNETIYYRDLDEGSDYVFLIVRNLGLKNPRDLALSQPKSLDSKKYLAFSAMDPSDGYFHIYFIEFDINNFKILKKWDIPKKIEIDCNSRWPSFSLDEKYLLFSNDCKGNFNIYAMNLSTLEIYKLLELENSNQKTPIYINDYLYFVSDHEGPYKIYRMKYNLKKKTALEKPIKISLDAEDIEYHSISYSYCEDKLILSREQDDVRTLWISDTLMMNYIPITSEGNDLYPALDCDTGEVFFMSDRQNLSDIWKTSYLKARIREISEKFARDIEKVSNENYLMNVVIVPVGDGEYIEDIVDNITDLLVNNHKVNVIDRKSIDEILEELNYKHSDLIDPKKRRKFAESLKFKGLSRAEIFAFIEVSKYGGSLISLLKIDEVGSLEVLSSDVEFIKGQHSLTFVNNLRTSIEKLGDEALKNESELKNAVFIGPMDSNDGMKIRKLEEHINLLIDGFLSDNDNLKIIDRKSFDYYLKERNLDMRGLLNPLNAASLKELLKIDYIIYYDIHQISELEGYYPISIFLVETSTGKVRDLKIIFLKKKEDNILFSFYPDLLEYINKKFKGNIELFKTKLYNKNFVLKLELEKELKEKSNLNAVEYIGDVIQKALLKVKMWPLNKELIKKYSKENSELQGIELKRIGADLLLEVKISSLEKSRISFKYFKITEIETSDIVFHSSGMSSRLEGKTSEEFMKTAREYYNNGEYELAIGELNRLIRNYPQKRYDKEVLTYLIECYYELREYKKALKYIEIYENKYQYDEDTLFRWKYYKVYIYFHYNNKHYYDEIEKMIKDLLKKQELPDLYLIMGIMKERENEYDKALEYFEKIKEGDYYCQAKYYEGKIYEKLGEERKAVEFYKLCPNYEHSKYRLIILFLKHEDLDNALKHVKELVNISKNKSKAFGLYQIILTKMILHNLESGKSNLEQLQKFQTIVEEYLNLKKRTDSLDYYLLASVYGKFHLLYAEKGYTNKAREYSEKAKKFLIKALDAFKNDHKLPEEAIKKACEIIRDHTVCREQNE